MLSKLKIVTFFILIASLKISAQDYLDVIAKKSCECLDKMPDTLSTDKFNLQFGICIIEASAPYKKQLKKDHDINLDNIDKEGEKLGHLVGIKMASTCPNSLLKIANKAKSDEEAPPSSEKLVKGTITKVENDFFVTFTVKDETGKMARFYWLTQVESKTELPTRYKTLLGRQTKITYITQDFFDPKIEEYRSFNIITKIETLGD